MTIDITLGRKIWVTTLIEELRKVPEGYVIEMYGDSSNGDAFLVAKKLDDSDYITIAISL